MKLIAILTILMSCNLLFASNEGKKELLPTIMLDSVKSDYKLAENESVVHFTFKGVRDRTQVYVLDYSIDGKVMQSKLNEKFSITLPVNTGEHRYQFYISGDYAEFEEVTLNNLVATGQKHQFYSINLVVAGKMISVEKPVLYFYPVQPTQVSLQLNVNGELTFTYPKYENGWNFQADPNGNLTMNGESYRYLFWESNYKVQSGFEKNEDGFCVAKEDVVSFLDEKLTEIGMNGVEKADFITFWAPRMLENNFALIRFMQNEACDEFAELDISPKPDHVNRFYVVWSSSSSELNLNPQTLTPLKRDGFTVLEWGGQELPLQLF